MENKRQRRLESEWRGRKKRECPYLLINRPFRKGKTLKIPRGRKRTGGEASRGGGGGFNTRGGHLQLLQRIAELLRSAVPGGPRIASSYRRGKKAQEESKDHVTLRF